MRKLFATVYIIQEKSRKGKSSIVALISLLLHICRDCTGGVTAAERVRSRTIPAGEYPDEVSGGVKTTLDGDLLDGEGGIFQQIDGIFQSE